ncbi:MAG: toll/interleukin-1 receptor domain-containing protein [Planctomycetaceae bacterium]|nr:toll/interleukin-1 receptor domain-containing protein [Planctomycetaceae bacterium]
MRVFLLDRRTELERRAEPNVLPRLTELRDTFRQKHLGARFTDSEFDTVIRQFQVQGLVWPFSFGSYVLLRPELLNTYASAVVRVARRHPRGLGSVAEDDVLDARIDFEGLHRLPDEVEERSLMHAVVELLLDRAVARRVVGQLVFPELLNREPPDALEARRRDVAYNFRGSVEIIYATLAVRLSYSGEFKLKELWKNVAEFHDRDNLVCGLELTSPREGHGVISLRFDDSVAPDVRVLFQAFVQEHFVAYKIDFDRLPIYSCPRPTCRKEILDRAAVEHRLRLGKPTAKCQWCDGDVPLVDVHPIDTQDPRIFARLRALEAEVRERKGGAVAETTVKAKENIGEIDVFLCYNSQDQSAVEQIADALQRRGLNPWFDKLVLTPGDPFTDAIQKAITTTRAGAVIIGPHGLSPFQVMEAHAMLNHRLKHKLRMPLIPVLLPGLDVVPPDEPFLQLHQWVRFVNNVDEADALSALERGIRAAST